MKMFAVIMLCVLGCACAQAEEIVLINGNLVSGEVVGETEQEIYIETESGLRSVSKSDIAVRTAHDLDEESVVSADQDERDDVAIDDPSLPLDEQITRQYYAMRQFLVTEVPKWKRKAKARIVPHHRRLLAWTEATTAYKLMLKLEFLQKYKRTNKAGFIMSIYCVLLLICAVVIRLIKEGIFLIVGIFGIDTKQKRR